MGLQGKRIAVIEDDRSLNNGIVLALKHEGYQFAQYGTLEEARAGRVESACDLLVLDINLPDGDGFAYLQEIRRTSDIPVIILTANDLETDEVMGLELGADDYITKPFSLMVLRARIEKALNRDRAGKSGIYQAGGFSFDFGRMLFYREGQEIVLSKTEQKLLRHLVENSGITLSRGKLVDLVWTDGAEYVDENALSVAVKRLRDKLEPCPPKPRYLKTVYGIGYVWQEEEKP